MNWPNLITLGRMFLIPIYIVILPNISISNKHIFSLCIIGLGALLDILDGYIARKYNLITDIGTVLDPLADKLLLVTVGIGLWLNNKLPFWLVIFIIVREGIMIIGGLINYLYTKIVIPANILGKINTGYVYVLIVSYIFNWSIRGYLAIGFIGLVLLTTVNYINIFFSKISTKNDKIKVF
jgi:cardiolipin synthase